MVRVISQETYDEAVKQNIEEFSMSAKEAIEETVKEFEAQVNINKNNKFKKIVINLNKL